MYKIIDAVKEKLTEDLDARTALIRGIMNYSAYAELILADIENRMFKTIDKQTIVVALSRISKSNFWQATDTDVRLTNLTIHPGLIDFTVERTAENLRLINKIEKNIGAGFDRFFTITLSTGEITIIADQTLKVMIMKVLAEAKFISKFTGLNGITVKFSQSYLSVPNTIYSLTKKLAASNVNIIEIVSTATELTYLVAAAETELAVRALNNFVAYGSS
jgi:hypothetical protein